MRQKDHLAVNLEYLLLGRLSKIHEKGDRHT